MDRQDTRGRGRTGPAGPGAFPRFALDRLSGRFAPDGMTIKAGRTTELVDGSANTQPAGHRCSLMARYPSFFALDRLSAGQHDRGWESEPIASRRRRAILFTAPVSVQCQIDTVSDPNGDNIAGSVDKWCGLWTTPQLSGMTGRFPVSSWAFPQPVTFLVTGGVFQTGPSWWRWGQPVPWLCVRSSGPPMGNLAVIHTIHSHYYDDDISYFHMFNVNDPCHN